MKTASSKIAFAFITALGAMTSLPVAAALADTATHSAPVVGASAGTYDSGDMFRDAKGFPLTGWQGLIFPANS